MTTAARMTTLLTRRGALWLAVAAGLLLVIGANAHLIAVAVTSQPECVAHVRPGEGAAQRGAFSAAQSSCSPGRPGSGREEAE
jgi:hypothetical protein